MASALLTSLSGDVPWFVQVAADPLLQLLELHPHLNLSALAHSQPANPFKTHANQFEKRGSCYTLPGNNNNNTTTTASSGPSGALIGGIVAAVIVVIILAGLAFFFWRRSHRAKQQQKANNNPVSFPNTGASPATPYDHGTNPNGPPPMAQTSTNNLVPGGANYTSAVYPVPPPSSMGGWNSNSSNTGSGTGLLSNTAHGNPQDGRQSYYNYAPPPSEPQNAFAGAGMHPPPSSNYYNISPSDGSAPSQWNPALGMYSGTPSPPPPSTTPGAASSHSGTTAYAPWAVPHSAASGSSSPPPQMPGGGGLTFATAAEEKAHYSGYHPPPSAPSPAPSASQIGGSSKVKENEGTGELRTSAPTPAPPAYEPYTASEHP